MSEKDRVSGTLLVALSCEAQIGSRAAARNTERYEMNHVSNKVVKSIQADRRSNAAEHRKAKAARVIKVRKERRQLRLPIPVAHLLRRLALG